MFCSVKVRILCIFICFSLVHLSHADSSIIVLKRIEKQLTEFKLKHENLQLRIGEFLSIVYREYKKEEGCFNTTFETFNNKNDLDPFGNLNILRMELELASLLSDNGKIGEPIEINVQQELACEKVNENIRKDLTSYGNELTNRLSNEITTQLEAQKKLLEANEISLRNINSNHQILFESLTQTKNTTEAIRNVLNNNLKTKFEAQNLITQRNVNAKHQQLPDTLDKHIRTLGSPCSEGLPQTCSEFGKIMIQHQLAGSVDFFNRTWNDFKDGFGTPNGQFWLGLDNIRQLTSSRHYELHVVGLDFNNVTNHVVYDNFQIGDERDMYKIKKLGRFSGNEKFNILQYHTNMPFSTFDKNNQIDKFNCALEYNSGWWYYENDDVYCFYSNFNLNVQINKTEDEMYVSWFIGYPLKEVYMYIKLH